MFGGVRALKLRQPVAVFVFSIFAFLISGLVSDVSLAGGFSVNGPRIYVRDNGAPFVETDSFTVTNPEIPYTLKIQNGGTEGDIYEMVASTVIKLNGEVIVSPNEINPNISYIEKAVTVQAVNELAVEVRGKPGGALIINIDGTDNTAPTISPNVSPSANANGWHNSNVTVSFDCEDNESGIASCADTQTITTEGAGQIAAGQAEDKAGNTSETSVTINLDKSLPVMELISPVGGITVTGSTIEVAGQVRDSYSSVQLTINGTVTSLGADGSFTRTVPLMDGLNPITLVATDSAGNQVQEIRNVIYQPNQPPVATSQTINTNEDVAKILQLIASDADGDSLNYQIVTQPRHGVLSGVAPNLTYTPNQDFFGNDSIGYLATDGQLSSNEAFIDISVSSVNDAPVAFDQNIAIDQNQSVLITLTGSDVEMGSLTYQITTQPAHGTVTGIAPNLQYSPATDFTGTDSFDFVVNDGNTDSAPANVVLTVNTVNQAPVITSTPVQVAIDGTAYRYLVTASDNEGDSFSFSLSQSPVGMSISPASGEILWTPDATQIGEHIIVVEVTDRHGAGNQQAYELTVNPEGNNTPEITSGPVTSAVHGSAYIYAVTATDADADALSFHLDQGPFDMDINAATGEISWLPSYADIGDHIVLVRVKDVHDAYTTQRYTLNVVAGSNLPPVITSQAELEGAAGSLYTYLVTAEDPDNDMLSYRLDVLPSGMSINTDTGLISWLPEDTQVGSHTVTVIADDASGGTASQTYSVNVAAAVSNTAPQMISPAITSVIEGVSYVYDADAVDAEDQDSLLFRLEAAPANMSVHPSTGGIVWPVNSKLVQPVVGHNSACFSESGSFEQIRVEKTLLAGYATLTPPISVPLSDSNADGQIDISDVPATIYMQNGYIAAVRVDNGSFLWSVGANDIGVYQFEPTASVASADIDNDGLFEIISVLQTSDSLRLFALNNDGSLKWINTDIAMQRSADITIGDLNKDGQMEIVVGDKIFDSEGVLMLEAEPSASIDGHGVLGQQGMIIDLDLDGDNEILTGFYAYDEAGNQLWHASGLTSLRSGAAFGVGNFDNDDFPEVITVSGHHLSLVQHDGSVAWGPVPFDIYTSPNIGGGGTPVIADFDHDGLDEIFVIGRTKAALVDGDGSVLWQINIDDSSSGSVGATAFDLNNDGEMEIIFTDEVAFYIVSSRDGRIIYQDNEFNSGTLQEHPIIADLDGDGAAEILVAGYSGLAMYDSAGAAWNWTSPLWTQNRFYPNVVNDSGQYNPDNHFWLSGIGFGVNAALTMPLQDITARAMSYDSENSRVTATIVNRGLANIDTGFIADLYLGDPQLGGQLIGQSLVGPVDAGVSQNVSFNGIAISGSGTLYLRLDTENVLSECDVRNNSIAASYVQLEVTDPGGLSDQQSYLVNVVPSSRPPIIVSVPVSTVTAQELYQYAIEIDDNPGDVHSYNIISAPSGMQVKQASGTLVWRTADADVGSHDFTLRVTDANGSSVDQAITINVAANPNLPPVIQSLGLQTAYVDQEYSFSISASDPDGDDTAIVYELWGEPTGMTVDASTGRVSWHPASTDIGEHRFVVAARDADGRDANIQVIVNVDSGSFVNEAPVITSAPTTSLLAGYEYIYQLNASDAENEPLVYQLSASPDGMTVDTTGRISWLTADADIGLHPVVIQVRDSYGNYALQSYSLSVTATSGFSIVSTPVTATTIDTYYSYSLSIGGEDVNNLALSLVQAPSGMTITSQGAISWLPSVDDVGIHSVQIEASNAYGNTATQTYNLSVEQYVSSTPPVYSGQPEVQAIVDVPYSYQVLASDPEGDSLSYALVSAPAGMMMDDNGLVTWTPSIFDIGSHQVAFKISDGFNILDVSFVIVVDETPPPIIINIQVEPQIVDPGEDVTITVNTSGGYGEIASNLTVDGQPVSLTNGQAIINSTDIGRHDIHVASSTSNDVQVAGSFFSVRDIADTSAPQVYIVSPTSGSTITSPTDVFGIVHDDNLAHVLLAARRKGDESYITLYEGSDVFEMTRMGEFDPTMLVNGIYEIFIIASDINGQQSSTVVNTIVEDDLKIGDFSFTVEDLNIPLAGMPIRVTRTYDSRRKHEDLDFGYGWSVDYQNVRVEESVEPSIGWHESRATLPFILDGTPVNIEASCTQSTFNKFVTVTLPNGDVERFDVRVSPTNNSPASVADPDCYLVADNYYNLIFDAQPGTESTLASADGSSLYLNAAGNLAYIDDSTPVPINRYTLTTREGFVYQLNQQFGIETVIDPNGNTLTYSDTGIVHSSGKSISFDRDVNGRIISITDPENNVIEYSYSRAGNLRSTTNGMGYTTDYSYYSDHYLEDINDPLGRRLLRNIYDNDGRLVAQEDNDGRRIGYDHNVAGRVSTVTNRRFFTTQYAYDDHGNVLSQTDALGHTTRYSYDADDNQLSKTDPLLHTSTATYNAAGDQLTQTDALGNINTFTYNDRGQELTVTDALQHTFTNTYDSYGNLNAIEDPLHRSSIVDVNNLGLPIRVVDASGAETTYTYDGYGNKETETNDLGHTTTYSYDNNGNVLTESRTRTVDGIAQTEVTHYAYDDLDRLIQTTDPLGRITRHEYDEMGNKVRDIDAFGRIILYTYDAYRRLIRTDYPDTTFSTRDYDAEGNLIRETDRDGHVIRYVYDPLNRRTHTYYGEGLTTSPYSETIYDAAGRVIAEIDENGNRTEHEYDAADRRILTRDAFGNETTFGYDANGNLTSQTDANGHTTQFEYDAVDNRVRTIYHDTTESTQGYDAMGRVTSKTDQNGYTTTYVYDGIGQLVEVQDAQQGTEQGITRYSYDEAGNKLSQTDAEDRITRWTYDALGRELSRTLPLGQVEYYTYDGVGDRITHTDFNGQQTQYQYDSNHRVERIDYSDLTHETFGYTHEGQRSSATTRGGTNQSWGYDSRNRLAWAINAHGDRLDYDYDNVGNRTALTVTPAGGTAATTAYGYDALNRLATVTDPNNLVTRYSYDNVGNRASVTYPNGNVVSYVYDSLNRLTRQGTVDSIGTVLTDYQYTLDGSGHRLQITEASGRVTDYSYDRLYRLLTEVVTDAVNGNYSAAYSYDKVGNRVYSTIDGVQTQYTYDANDRLTQLGGATYGYDDNGNKITETLDGNTDTYSYNVKNELVGSSKGSITSSYAYDVDGIRTQKTEEGSTTDYLIDHNRDYAQVIQETTGTAEVNYLYGDDLIRQDRDGAESYYLYDGLGSTRALADSSGAITDAYDYEAFGDVLSQTGTTENSYRFTGEQYDANLDHYYLRARYYNPNIGRFTQMDTWMGRNQDPVTLHKYLYANVDPVNNIDPTGKFSLSSVLTTIRIMGRLSSSVSAQIGGITSGGRGLALFGGTTGAAVLAMKPGFQLRTFSFDLMTSSNSNETWDKAVKLYDFAGAYIQAMAGIAPTLKEKLDSTKALLDNLSSLSNAVNAFTAGKNGLPNLSCLDMAQETEKAIGAFLIDWNSDEPVDKEESIKNISKSKTLITQTSACIIGRK